MSGENQVWLFLTGFEGIVFTSSIEERIFDPPVGCRFICWLQSHAQFWHSALFLWTEEGRLQSARVDYTMQNLICCRTALKALG